MILIHKNPNTDTRTCDVTSVSKEQLLESSRRHIMDVSKAIAYFSSKLTESAAMHDFDKLTKIDWFYDDFLTNFENTGWWDNHRKIHRHHLNYADGIPDDVNLLDVIEYISDCIMAGMARKGEVYPLTINSDVLMKAFNNTANLLESQVSVMDMKNE